MGKKLVIDCVTCDARSVTEATLDAYEEILIHCVDLMVTPQAKELLHSRGVTLDCSSVLELSADVRHSLVQGKAKIRAGEVPGEKVFLDVSGILEIGPGAREVLDQYEGIRVNGKLICPESLSSCLGLVRVNGKTVVYPDDAIVLKRNAVIDRAFLLRAKARRYWSEKRIILVDPKLNPQALAAKGVFFSAQEVILAESMAESLVDSIDESAEILLVPDGTSVVTGDLKLDRLAVEKYGRKLYILGDLDLDREDGEALAQVEYLSVRGDAKVPQEWKQLLLKKLTELTGELKIKKGRFLSNQISLRISKSMLEQERDGIQAENCVLVALDPDIPDSLILERLRLRECVTVRCTPEQEGALALVSEAVVTVETGEKPDISQVLPSASDKGKDRLDTRTVNAVEYIL